MEGDRKSIEPLFERIVGTGAQPVRHRAGADFALPDAYGSCRPQTVIFMRAT